ncbi:MAG: GNAT family N-acetyltransferase [Candidatus Rokubacteria bacterium]|nr:GNAT family N-acetyltransferase [Candidatus Rokubacteria bacterium]
MPDIVPFEEHHGPGVLALIGGVFREYGLTFEPGGYDADLTRIPGSYFLAGGAFWVLEDDGQVVGTVAIVPIGVAEVEIKRVYLDSSLRGRGWGRAMVEHALAWASANGHTRVRLWSDVKFTRSHVMYERLGFARAGIRDCDDLDQSREYGFAKSLSAFAPCER